jgi:hypothetical protein
MLTDVIKCVILPSGQSKEVVMSDKKNTGSLISTLLEVQQDLSHAKASATNPHFKSQYVPFEALWDYAKEHLNGKGILIQQISHECEVGACIETVLHGFGESLSTGKMIVRADKPTAQSFGSAVTYAKRYSLSMALGIGADKDDDANKAETGSKRSW